MPKSCHHSNLPRPKYKILLSNLNPRPWLFNKNNKKHIATKKKLPRSPWIPRKRLPFLARKDHLKTAKEKTQKLGFFPHRSKQKHPNIKKNTQKILKTTQTYSKITGFLPPPGQLLAARADPTSSGGRRPTCSPQALGGVFCCLMWFESWMVLGGFLVVVWVF